jgi:hypothetical protein
MTSTRTPDNAEKLPVETEINIFRKMNTMRDVLKYASTNKYRRNILKNHVTSILLNNKKLREDDFLTWYRVLTHFSTISIEDKNKYLIELLIWIKKVLVNKQRDLYKKAYNIVYKLINTPFDDLKTAIKQSDVPIRILPENYNNPDKFSKLMRDFFIMYFLDIDDTFSTSERLNKYIKIQDAVLKRRPGYLKYIDEHDVMSVFFDFIKPAFVR